MGIVVGIVVVGIMGTLPVSRGGSFGGGGGL